MLSRTPNAPARLSQRSHAQRRLRRNSNRRLFCTTNGCATYLEPDASGHHAVCPICGLRRSFGDRTTRPAGQVTH